MLNARSLVREVMPSFDFHAGEDITEFLNFVHKHGRLATELVFGIDITAHITARTSISMNRCFRLRQMRLQHWLSNLLKIRFDRRPPNYLVMHIY